MWETPREWSSKLGRTLSGRRGLAADLNAEIESHLAFEIQENLARGMSPDDARSAARRHVGAHGADQGDRVDARMKPEMGN